MRVKLWVAYTALNMQKGGPLCHSLPEWDALGDEAIAPQNRASAPRPSMDPPQLRPKEKEKYSDRKKREQVKFIALQKKRDKDRLKRRKELERIMKRQRDQKKAEAAKRFEDEKPQREAATRKRRKLRIGTKNEKN